MNLRVEYIEPQYVSVVWPKLAEGMDRAFEKSDREVSAKTVIDQLLEGRWSLHIIYDDEAVLGAGVVQPMIVEGGYWLNVPFGFSLDAHRTEVLDAFFDKIELEARENDAIGVKMASARKGFMRRMKKRGYRQRMVEFVYRFEDEEDE